jgi:hypothetical protein
MTTKTSTFSTWMPWTKAEMDWIEEYARERPRRSNKHRDWKHIASLFADRFGYKQSHGSLSACAKGMREKKGLLNPTARRWTSAESMWLKELLSEEVLEVGGEWAGWTAAARAFKDEFGHSQCQAQLLSREKRDHPLVLLSEEDEGDTSAELLGQLQGDTSAEVFRLLRGEDETTEVPPPPPAVCAV